jgi:hypothetical protein
VADDAAATGGLTVVLHPAMYRPRTAEVIAQHLRRKVIDGELKEGDFLPTETASRGQSSTPFEFPTPILSITSAPAMSQRRSGIGEATSRRSAESSPTTTDGRRYAGSH